jgi:ELWxxDGT repeat protein
MNATIPSRIVCWALFSALLLVPVLGRTAASVQLVRDINTVPVPANAYPQAIGTLGPNVLFNATDPEGPGLWTTNGTKQSTYLLHEFKGTGYVGGPGSYLPAGSRAYFVTSDGAGTSAVWVTNGLAAGTKQLIAFPSVTTASAYLFGFIGSRLLLSAPDAKGDPQLYAVEISDGVPGAVERLTSFTGGINAGILASAGGFIIGGGKLFFATIGAEIPSSGEYPREIWVSDGTASGTHALTTSDAMAVYNPQSFQLVGSLVMYVSDGTMFTIDPATETIVRLSAAQGVTSPQLVVNMGDYLLYIVGTSIVQLWRTNGTVAGTQLLRNLGEFTDVSFYGPSLERVGTKALFTEPDGAASAQLWSTDGTVANTVELTHASAPSDAPWPLVLLGSLDGTAYFYASDGPASLNATLWRTDGTPGGTGVVPDVPSFYIGNGGVIQMAGDSTQVYFGITLDLYDTTQSLYRYLPESNVTGLVKSGIPVFLEEFFFSNGQLFYSYEDPVIGSQPWVTNGTAAGTHLIEDINPDVDDNSSNPDEFVEFEGQLVFAADDGISGRELWISNGTSAGTRRLADINPGPASSNPNHLFTANGALYFFATDGTGKSKFMRLAHVGADVEAVATLSPQPTGAAGYCGWDGAVVIGTKMYFAANDGHTGLELWTSDGTPAGTHLTADIAAGTEDSYPCWLTALDQRVYFSAMGRLGNELWTSDGTEAGTVEVADIAPGTASSNPAGLLVYGNNLYFDADDTVHGTQLWASSGTAAGTRMISDIDSPAGSESYPIGAFKDKLLFQTNILHQNQNVVSFLTQFWTTNGTAGGTAPLSSIFFPSGANPFISGSQFFFTGGANTDIEPWVSDGTANGTHVLKDINPSGGASPSWFQSFAGKTLFEVSNAVAGEQLWQSTGTAATTTFVADIPAPDPNPSPVTSAVHRLAVGSNFFFAAHSNTTGTELYVLTGDVDDKEPTTRAR